MGLGRKYKTWQLLTVKLKAEILLQNENSGASDALLTLWRQHPVAQEDNLDA